MTVMSIIRPFFAANVYGSFTNPTRMVSPDPKEVAYATPAGAHFIDLDLGSTQLIGALYLGGVSGTTTFSVSGGTVGYGDVSLGNIVVAPKRTALSPRQYLLQFTPQNLRYFRISATLANNFEIGLALPGERFSPTWGHEWGAGRGLIDTGTAARNRAGGFGIDPGVVVPTWDFTLGDLTDEEREYLYDILRKVGSSRPIIVCEDPDVSTDLDARLHYGIFSRLEKYERQTVGITRWSLRVEDWI